LQNVKIISPVDGSVYRELHLTTAAQLEAALDAARAAQHSWRKVPLAERAAIVERFNIEMLKRKVVIGEEITWQMGRPIAFTPKEVERAVERSRKMIELSERGLSSLDHSDISTTRKISRRPFGVALVVAPWNYPFLTAINTIVPALLSGNAVILKPASQTALTGMQMAECFELAGLPEGLFQSLLISHEDVARILSSRGVDFVAFTGSVRGGAEIEKAAAGAFLPITLELGGKDAAYVMRDADLDFTVPELVDGAFFNSGQSCCGVERIYVDKSIYHDFVARFVVNTKQTQKLGNPLLGDITLGPIVTQKAAVSIKDQVKRAVLQGAKVLAGEETLQSNDNYMAATVLNGVNHTMDVMTEETFGPVIGIMPVEGPEEALKLINDSKYGLSASLWTKNQSLANQMVDDINAGTIFINRCDYLDPSLAWTGLKDSGRGCSLSELGFQSVTRASSFYAR
jgi:acyl-CoA reductase-like NAD-dependent aldehyde dehydrogenase